MADEQTKMETDQPPAEWGEDISPDKDGKLFKKIIGEGKGESFPGKGNEVSVHYTGTLLDGTVFDSSVQRNQLFKFNLGEGKVIRGWDVGVATMKKGEKCLLTCTPEYAYGEQGAGDKIPPNSTLQFEVELFSWSGEDVTGDGGVVKYPIKGTDDYGRPTEGSTVTVSLKGLIGDRVFEERNNLEFCLGEGGEVGVVEGVEKGIEKMAKGEEAEFVIQSNYGFGVKGNKDVPPNTEITYRVTLTEFVKVRTSYEYDDVTERVSDATATKGKGSEYFKNAKYPLALKVYRRALKLVEQESITKDEEKETTRPIRIQLRLNIAACLLKLQEGTEALHECESVLEEDAINIKGLFRKGQAYQITHDYELAVRCFMEVLKHEPSNGSARKGIKDCRAKLKEQKDSERKMYSNIFQKMSVLSERDHPTPVTTSNGDTANGDDDIVPEKDIITETMEEEEKKENIPA